MPGSVGKSARPSRSCEKLSSVWVPASGSEGPSAWRAQVLVRVGDVLAGALVARTLQVDDGGRPGEVVRRLHLEAFEPVRVDHERWVADAVVGRHPPERYVFGPSWCTS